MLELEAESFRNPPRLPDRAGALRLREVHEPAVVAEVLLCELRVTIEAERADHQPLEVPQQKVRQVERSRLSFGELSKYPRGGQKLVAMSPGQPLDTFLLEHGIELSAGAAVT